MLVDSRAVTKIFAAGHLMFGSVVGDFKGAGRLTAVPNGLDLPESVFLSNE
jgi:hypothetical protein